MKATIPVSVSASRNLVSFQHRTSESLRIVRFRYDQGEQEVPDLAQLRHERRVALPTADAGGFEYRLPADSSIALEVDKAADARAAVTAIADVLAELHGWGDDSVATGAHATPSWIRRLKGHLRAIRCSANDVAAFLGREIPAEYFDAPLVPTSSSRPCLLHGAPSLALTYLTEQRALVLAGEDISTGPPEMDWGFLVGEIAEIALLGSYPIARHCQVLNSIVDTYTPGMDRRSIMAFAQHRTVLHILDYADSFISTIDDMTDEWFALLRSIQWDQILP
ncbi:hypothetical protein [Rhodococcus rhodnii]|uniref:hypothetical protein n=1 Tax=Rhodococcus rhodnii TaxID=38312 RepID=UPI001160A1AA|nr:hypothetical protein [Rhodococcus rhodnii]